MFARVQDMRRWAAAADEAAAQREAKIGALEAERDTLKRAALAELTVCRDAGLQAVYELEAQVRLASYVLHVPHPVQLHSVHMLDELCSLVQCKARLSVQPLFLT